MKNLTFTEFTDMFGNVSSYLNDDYSFVIDKGIIYVYYYNDDLGKNCPLFKTDRIKEIHELIDLELLGCLPAYARID